MSETKTVWIDGVEYAPIGSNTPAPSQNSNAELEQLRNDVQALKMKVFESDYSPGGRFNRSGGGGSVGHLYYDRMKF